MKSFWSGAAAIAATLAFAGAADAAVTTFASFNATNSGNIVWQNDGTGGTANSFRANGTGGSLFTQTNLAANGYNPNAAVAAPVNVKFSFLTDALAPFVTDVDAKFMMNLSVAATPASQMMVFGQPYVAQWGLAGGFSFKSAHDIVIGNKTYAAGANLLSATLINDQTVFGQKNATSGGLSAATSSGATITYTSDFLDLSNTTERDAAFSLTAIQSLVNGANKGLNQATTSNSLRSFRATATGSFSADIAAVPEPATWAMMLGGFGLIGAMSRRSQRVKSVLA
ncbi:PEPxxWA-CTERM sorting domain-containing protein [Sphingomonas sp.]|jgi:hypothetical protein|uniref:PEPxxWA-CTERM sorting domain-containing protein n=1 Tax=Sphingomonas sp. TaxID=28214 RepID=UPI002DEA633E|nr:PEPxxWA-CTERM sorting domain-containing protein [Sphingomonas sp.]